MNDTNANMTTDDGLRGITSSASTVIQLFKHKVEEKEKVYPDNINTLKKKNLWDILESGNMSEYEAMMKECGQCTAELCTSRETQREVLAQWLEYEKEKQLKYNCEVIDNACSAVNKLLGWISVIERCTLCQTNCPVLNDTRNRVSSITDTINEVLSDDWDDE